MAKQRFSGPKYANGNHKSQQKAYNKTPKGKALINKRKPTTPSTEASCRSS